MTSSIAGQPVVQARELYFAFGSVVAVDRLNLSVPPGTSFGLVGPNGAGKSTLIRLIVGLLNPQDGSLAVMGRLPHNAASSIGYMPQLSAIYTELSTMENVDFFARIYGLSHPRQRRERVEEALGLVGLWERRNDPVLRLSGGMRQRVSLACSLVHRPPLLVLDEPTVGLDPELRMYFWEHFKQLNAEGVTLVVSSHTMDDAAHCDRLAFLRAGRVVAEGTPQELVQATGNMNATLEQAFLHFIRQKRA